MRKLSRSAIAIMLVLVLIAGLCGCTTYANFKNAFFGNDDAKDKVIKIGVYEPISGKSKAYGKEEIIGIELAHELFPTACGKDVELVYADNHSNIYSAETAIQELINVNAPLVILGSYGETLSLVASDYINAASIPAITISGTNPLITANNDYYFSATYSETRQGDALADICFAQLHRDIVATVKVQNDDKATATIKRFTNRMKKVSDNNRCVVGNFEIGVNTTDYSETIEKIRTCGAKAVFLNLSPTSAKEFMKQAIDLKLTHVTFLGTREWNDKELIAFVEANPKLNVAYPSEDSEGITSEMSDRFTHAFKEKYGENAVPSHRSAVGFDAYVMSIMAIENAMQICKDTDPESITENAVSDAAGRAELEAWNQAIKTGIPTSKHVKSALNNINDYEGASGSISYNGKNEATKSITIIYYAEGIKMNSYMIEV